jgi:hypothetical protein
MVLSALSRRPRSAGSRLSVAEAPRWPIAVLAISYLGAVFLCRHNGAQWPEYMLAALTVVNLFAVVFSKGMVLRAVAVMTLLAVCCWAAWWDSLVKPVASGPIWHWGPVALWGAAVLYALVLGMSVPLKARRRFSVPVLVMAAFVFGMWAVFAANLQYGFGYSWLPVVALPVTAVAPLVVILIDVLRGGWDKGVPATVSALLVAVSGYLTVVQVALEALNHALQRLPSKILGLPPVAQTTPFWFAWLSWKTVASAAVFAVAMAVIVSSSIVSVANDPPAASLSSLQAQIGNVDNRLASSSDALSRIAEHIIRVVLRGSLLICLAADFAVRVAQRVLVALWQAGLRACIAVLNAIRQLALPLACFSVCSLLMMTVIGDVARYGAGLSYPYSAVAMLGGLLVAAVLILALCGVSTALSAVSTDWVPSPSGIAPAVLLSCLFYILLTVVTPALWALHYALDRAGLHVTALRYGPLLFVNLCLVLGFLVVIAIPVLMSTGFTMLAGKSSSPNYKVIVAGMTCALTAVSAFAVLLGYEPVAHWISVIT